MEDGDGVAEAGPEAVAELRGEGDLRDEDDRPAAVVEGRGDGLEVDLGLAAAGDPVEEGDGEAPAGEALAELLQGGELIGGRGLGLIAGDLAEGEGIERLGPLFGGDEPGVDERRQENPGPGEGRAGLGQADPCARRKGLEEVEEPAPLLAPADEVAEGRLVGDCAPEVVGASEVELGPAVLVAALVPADIDEGALGEVGHDPEGAGDLRPQRGQLGDRQLLRRPLGEGLEEVVLGRLEGGEGVL